LQRARAQHRRTESAFKDLMDLLAGYPLALQVVLPHLAAKPAAEVIDELRHGIAEADAAVPGDDPVAARTRSLMACIDYSHGHLDPQAQALLACFAPFTGVINTDFLEGYQEALAAEPVLAGLPLGLLGEVLERARSLGLLQRDADHPTILRPQPALSWFLTRRLAGADQGDRRLAIERAFRSFYDGYARALNGSRDSGDDPQHRRAAQVLVEMEYANLGTALRLALDQQALILNPYTALSTHLSRLQDHRRGLELGDLVLARLEQMPRAAGMHGFEFISVIDDIANSQLALHQPDGAKASFERALTLADGLTGLDPRMVALLRASILHSLGRVAEEQRRFEEAEAAYKQALAIKLEFNDRHSAAFTYHQLGMIAHKRRRFDEAEAAYKQALAIKLEFNDRHSAASTYGELGGVALGQRRFAEAEAAYKQALAIDAEFNDRHSAAFMYHQLGIVAQEQRRFAEAEAAYKQALAIKLEFNDRYSAAKTYHHLGIVAQEQRRFAEAEAAYNQALEIYAEFNDRHRQAGTYHWLGRVAEEQRHFTDAEAAYNQALAISLEFNDRYGAALTYHELGIVAKEQRRFAEAEAAYNQALEIYVAFKDEHSLRLILGNLARLWRLDNSANIPAAVAAALNLNLAEAETLLKELSPQN